MEQKETMFSSVENFKEHFSRRIVEAYGRSVEQSHRFEKYSVLGKMIRDYASVTWKETKEKIFNNIVPIKIQAVIYNRKFYYR